MTFWTNPARHACLHHRLADTPWYDTRRTGQRSTPADQDTPDHLCRTARWRGLFSADGKRMIFQSEREPDNPFYQIYLLDLETGDTTRVSPGIGKTTCAWIHPHADKVLFASTHADPQARAKQQEELAQRASGQARRYAWDFDEHYDIFEADSQGGHLNNLTHVPATMPKARGRRTAPGSSLPPTAMPTPNRASTPNGPSWHAIRLFIDIYLMRADGTQVQRLTQAPGYDGGRSSALMAAKSSGDTLRRTGPRPKSGPCTSTARSSGSSRTWASCPGRRIFTRRGVYHLYQQRPGHGQFELYIVDSAGSTSPCG